MRFDLSKIVKRLIPIILIGIIGNIIFAVYTSEENLLDALSEFSPGWFIIAIIISLIPWLGHSIRTVIWSRFLHFPVSFKDSLRISIAHDLGGAITPTVVGGTPIKFGLLVNKGVPAGSAGMIVLLQVLEDLVFLISSLPLSIYFGGGLGNPAVSNLYESIGTLSIHLWWLIPALALLVVTTRFVYRNKKKSVSVENGTSFWQKVKKRIGEAWSDFTKAGAMILKGGKLRFLLTAAMMYMEWSCRFAIPIALVYSLGIDADPFQLFFLHWIVWLTMLITPTPGASGGAEAVFYFLFIPFIPESLIGILITGWRFVSYYFMMLIGAVILQIIGVISSKAE